MSGPEKFPEALLDRYLTGTISEADRKVLMDWFDRFSDEEVTVESPAGRSKEMVRESIWQAIQKRTAPSAASNKVRYYSNRYRGVAAACILLVALSWWAVNYFSASRQQVADKATVQAAGRQMDHNGAILTLSNGRKVPLDSTGTGQIALQAGTRILQQGGQIRYLGQGNASSQTVEMNTMTTPRGKQFSLILPDGTKVWLNAASSITYPVAFAKDSRSVSITGEAYFEVAHVTAAGHATRVPFYVQSGQLQVAVLGTHFDIQNYPEQRHIKTTLLEGSVAVHYGKNGPQKTMVPGQQAALDRSDPDHISLYEVDTLQSISWKNGLFSFKDEPLADILKEVARWYDVEADAVPSKLKLRFSGVISKRARLADLLAVLSATGVVQFKVNENKVYGY